MQVLKHTRTWIVVTWAFIFFTLALIQIAASGADAGSDSGGRTAAFALALIAVIPLFVRSLELSAPRWLPYLIGLVSFTIPVGLWLLVHSGRDSLAWSTYGGLQVLRSKWEFADLFQVLRWIDCSGCTEFHANYGPGLPWMHHLAFGVNLVPLTPVLAIVLVLVMSLAIGWLASQSGPLGGGLLLVAVFGGAWILLLDRANLDALAILLPVVAVIVLRRWNNYWTWTAVAAAIWILGTWKFYPFALGILLLPVLRVRRGWIILLSFAIASLGFMLVNWQEFRRTSGIYDTFVIVTDFPALGRTAITARLLSEGSLIPNERIASLIVVVMCVAALMWGLVLGRKITPTRNWAPAILAASGATLFLLTILIAGFGFQYKAAFLLLCAPLLGVLATQRNRAALYTALVCAALTAVACVIGYSILLTSIAGLVAGSLLLGAALVPILRYSFNRDHLVGADHQSHGALSGS